MASSSSEEYSSRRSERKGMVEVSLMMVAFCFLRRLRLFSQREALNWLAACLRGNLIKMMLLLVLMKASSQSPSSRPRSSRFLSILFWIDSSSDSRFACGLIVLYLFISPPPHLHALLPPPPSTHQDTPLHPDRQLGSEEKPSFFDSFVTFFEKTLAGELRRAQVGALHVLSRTGWHRDHFGPRFASLLEKTARRTLLTLDSGLLGSVLGSETAQHQVGRLRIGTAWFRLHLLSPVQLTEFQSLATLLLPGSVPLPLLLATDPLPSPSLRKHHINTANLPLNLTDEHGIDAPDGLTDLVLIKLNLVSLQQLAQTDLLMGEVLRQRQRTPPGDIILQNIGSLRNLRISQTDVLLVEFNLAGILIIATLQEGQHLLQLTFGQLLDLRQLVDDLPLQLLHHRVGRRLHRRQLVQNHPQHVVLRLQLDRARLVVAVEQGTAAVEVTHLVLRVQVGSQAVRTQQLVVAPHAYVLQVHPVLQTHRHPLLAPLPRPQLVVGLPNIAALHRQLRKQYSIIVSPPSLPPPFLHPSPLQPPLYLPYNPPLPQPATNNYNGPCPRPWIFPAGPLPRMRRGGKEVLAVRGAAPTDPQAVQGLPGQVPGVQDEERTHGGRGNGQTRLRRVQLLGNRGEREEGSLRTHQQDQEGGLDRSQGQETANHPTQPHLITTIPHTPYSHPATPHTHQTHTNHQTLPTDNPTSRSKAPLPHQPRLRLLPARVLSGRNIIIATMLGEPTGPQTGKRIKNYIYNYCDLIGRGNFARVYRGLNQKTTEQVAIKIVSLDALKSRRLEELIFEEIRILQRMNHPNILKFHEALLSERNCYIVTELCNEGDLEQRIKRKRLSESELQKVIGDIYCGLKYLREMKVTHRDFKTANIFLQSGQAKIADFGLAKFYNEKFKDLDIGSPLYMSPEGLLQHLYGEKTDMWAFGIVIYELLHGETPFCHCASEAELKQMILKPLPDSKWRKDVHPALRQLVNALLEINELKRPNVYELTAEPYLKAIIGSSLVPQIGYLNTPPQQQQRTNSLQTPKQLTNVNRSMEQGSPLQKDLLRPNTGRQMVEPRNIQLGGQKVAVMNLNQSMQQPIHVQISLVNNSKRPVVRFCEQSYSMAGTHMGVLRQREFSEKTIETKESEEEKQLMMRGDSHHRNQ